jgi:hypothetical protein
MGDVMTVLLLDWDRLRYSASYLQLGPREIEVQRAVLGELHRLGIFAEAFDVGAAKLRGRVRGAFMRAGMDEELPRVMGGQTGAGLKGVSDIIGNMPDGQALWIEVKAPEWRGRHDGVEASGTIQLRAPGKLRPEQRQFLTMRHADGCVVGVAWHVLDLRTILPNPWAGRVA